MHFFPGDRGNFARETENAQTIGTVRRDLNVDHGLPRRLLDRLHFTAGHRQKFRQFLRENFDVDIFFKPADRKSHPTTSFLAP